MHEMAMRISNTENCAQGRGSPATSGLAKTLAERNDALNLARTLGAAGLRTTLCWQIARTLFRIGFSGSLAVFSGRLIVDGTFDMIALASVLVCFAFSSSAGLFAELCAAKAEDFVVYRLRTALKNALLRKSPARIRTLPTILANHALRHEHGKIEQRMTVYANSTMGVLMVAFLNAGIIDFFSALAIAVLAVFLGLCHLGLVHIPGFSGLALWQSLFILIIAAEFFTPFRRYAEQYHVKAEGQAAAKELNWYLDDSDTATLDVGNIAAKPFTLGGAFDVADLPFAGLIAIS